MNVGDPHISKHKTQLTSHIPAMLSWVLQADRGDGKCSGCVVTYFFCAGFFKKITEFREATKTDTLSLTLRFTAAWTHSVPTLALTVCILLIAVLVDQPGSRIDKSSVENTGFYRGDACTHHGTLLPVAVSSSLGLTAYKCKNSTD